MTILRCKLLSTFNVSWSNGKRRTDLGHEWSFWGFQPLRLPLLLLFAVFFASHQGLQGGTHWHFAYSGFFHRPCVFLHRTQAKVMPMEPLAQDANRKNGSQIRLARLCRRAASSVVRQADSHTWHAQRTNSKFADRLMTLQSVGLEHSESSKGFDQTYQLSGVSLVWQAGLFVLEEILGVSVLQLVPAFWPLPWAATDTKLPKVVYTVTLPSLTPYMSQLVQRESAWHLPREVEARCRKSAVPESLSAWRYCQSTLLTLGLIPVNHQTCAFGT